MDNVVEGEEPVNEEAITVEDVAKMIRSLVVETNVQTGRRSRLVTAVAFLDIIPRTAKLIPKSSRRRLGTMKCRIQKKAKLLHLRFHRLQPLSMFKLQEELLAS